MIAERALRLLSWQPDLADTAREIDTRNMQTSLTFPDREAYSSH